MLSLSVSQADVDGDTRGRKRRRIELACEECRERKRKCDGQRPVCGACTKRSGQVCIWNDDRNTKGWSNNYVEGLRSQIRELEEALRNIQAQQMNRNGPGSLSPIYTQLSGPTAVTSASQDANQPSRCNLEAAAMSLPSPTNVTTRAALSVNSLPAPGPPEVQSTTFPPAVHPQSACDQAIQSQNEAFDTTSSERCEPEVDAMGVISSSLQEGTHRMEFSSEYFGPSSTFSLLDEAHGAINQKLHGKHKGTIVSVQLDPNVKKTHNQPEYVTFGFFSVPPRAEADALVESYCSWVHSLYPFLHLPSFHRRYLRLWDSPSAQQDNRPSSTPRPNNDYYDGMGDKLIHCLINVVFALGTLFCPNIPTQERHSVSKTFFARSKKALDFDLLSCGSAALVQTLLLMGQYLQSTDVPSSCWNTIGLAIRVAQGIGLHFEPRCCRGVLCTKGHDQLEREMRRRTWTGAVLFDRVLSLTYGRPLMIHPVKSKTHFVLPAAIDDEFLSRDPKNPGCQNSESISLVECYVQAVKLQDILGQVLATFYNRETDTSDDLGEDDQQAGATTSRNDRIDDSDLQMLLNVDESLGAWLENLPLYLKTKSLDAEYDRSPPSSPETRRERLLKRQANVLKARFLHVRLTLLRPVLVTLCAQAQNKAKGLDGRSIQTTMRHDMMAKAANLCISAAQELIELIVSAMDQGSSIERLPAPWYNVFYIYNSAIVLLMGYLCWPKITTGISEDSLMADCNHSIAFFQAYESYSSSASRCRKVLESMKRQVFKHRNGSEFGNDPNLADSNGSRSENQSGPIDPSLSLFPSNFYLAPSDVITPSLFIEDMNLDSLNQAWLDEQTMDMECLYSDRYLHDV